MHVTNYNKVVLRHCGQPCCYPYLVLGAKRTIVVLPWLAAKDHVAALVAPPLAGVGVRMGRKRQNLWVEVRTV